MGGTHFVAGLVVRELEVGPAYLLQKLRLAGRGSFFGPARKVLSFFGLQSAEGLVGDIRSLYQHVSTKAPRQLELARPSCQSVTEDEALLICLFSAAQSCDDASRDSFFFHLFDRVPSANDVARINQICWLFLMRGLLIKIPTPSHKTPLFQ